MIENGTQTYTRTFETERKVTSDGDVEIQRFRSPRWAGDEGVTWEREVRTRKLPDGTVEKETTLRNPDGDNHLQPVQVIREKVTKGADAITIQRDVLRADVDGHWQPVQKEYVTETGTDKAKQSVQEILKPNTSGDWQVVERQTTSTRSSGEGEVTRSVRQLPDAYGRLADYERRDERTAIQAGKQTREITLQRRDLSDTDGRQFFLVQRTTEAAATAAGTTVRHISTESDFLYGSTIHNSSGHPQVVEERTEQETVAPDGSKQVVTSTAVRGPGDPTALRPAPIVVQQTDPKGFVRQIFLPAQ